MKHILFSAFAILLSGGLCHAQTVEYLVTESGSHYYGYVTEQIPGKSLTVKVDSAEINIPRSSMTDVNIVYDESTGERVGTFTADGVVYDGVVILDQSLKQTRVKVNGKHEYTIPWKDLVKKVLIDRSYPTYGIKGIVITVDNGRIDGIIAEQLIDKGVTIVISADGTERINNSDIASVSYEPISRESSLWEQVQFLDKLVMKDGSAKLGFISQRSSAGIISFLLAGNDQQETVRMSDVASYCKVENDRYKAPASDTRKSETVTPAAVKTAPRRASVPSEAGKKQSEAIPDKPTLIVNGVPVELKEIQPAIKGVRAVSNADVPDIAVDGNLDIMCWNVADASELLVFNNGTNSFGESEKPVRHIYLTKVSDIKWEGNKVPYTESGVCIVTTADYRYGITIIINNEQLD